jgi:protoheme IX farnesyltransferase
MTPVPQAALPAEFAASPAENAASASGFASGLDAARLRALSPSATATFIRDLCELFKIRVVALVLVTAWGGFYLGCGGFYPGSAESHISILTGGLWCALLGIGLVSAGAGALNEAFEYRTDARMRRTAGRPVAAGRFSLAQGVVAGLGALALGAVWLTLTTNLLTAALAVLTAFTYVAVYTPLKRVTALATFIGAFPGAMGPVLGWTAACGRVEPPALALFAILFVWQFPHLMAIAWLYREDYAHAGIRVLLLSIPAAVPRWPKRCLSLFS